MKNSPTTPHHRFRLQTKNSKKNANPERKELHTPLHPSSSPSMALDQEDEEEDVDHKNVGFFELVDNKHPLGCHLHNNSSSSSSGLVVGNYCHDVLFLDGRLIGREGLGGAASFVSNVFHALSTNSTLRYVSKVGPDFRYHFPHLPQPSSSSSSSSSPTTLFHAYFDNHEKPSHTADRVLKRVAACDQILPSDLVGGPFDFGLAVAVAGEISPETLARIIDVCRVVFVDAQALLRTFDADDGTVRLVPLRESGFFHLLPRIAFLKASADEAPFLGLQEIRRSCCVLVTNGKEGCTVYRNDWELHVPAFPAQQVDPTGAGDSFFGGFVAGLMMHGLSVPDAALLGNFFGSLTVRQIGLPKFHPPILQTIKDEVCRMTAEQGRECCSRRCEDVINFEKAKEHEEFMTFLATAADKLVRDGCATEGPNG